MENLDIAKPITIRAHPETVLQAIRREAARFGVRPAETTRADADDAITITQRNGWFYLWHGQGLKWGTPTPPESDVPSVVVNALGDGTQITLRGIKVSPSVIHTEMTVFYPTDRRVETFANRSIPRTDITDSIRDAAESLASDRGL